MGQAREVLQSYVDRARAVALELPAGQTRQAFLALTDFVLARTG